MSFGPVSERPYPGDWLKFDEPSYSRDPDRAHSTAGNLKSGTVVGRLTSTGTLKQYDPAQTDGTETIVGVLFDEIDTTLVNNAVPATLVARHATVKKTSLADAQAGTGTGIVWPDSIDQAQLDAGEAALAALGIIVREGA